MVEGVAETRGQAAERHVHDALRAALPPEYPIYHRTPRWCAKTRPRRAGPRRRGRPRHRPSRSTGCSSIEVKAGEPRRTRAADWWIGAARAADARRSSRPRRPSTTCGGRSMRCPDWPAARRAAGRPRRRLPRRRPREPAARARPPRARRPARHRPRRRRARDRRAPPARHRAGLRLLGRRRQPRRSARRPTGMALVDDSSPRPSTLHRLVRHDVEDDRDRLLEASQRAAPTLDLSSEPAAGRGRRAGRQRQVDGRGREGPAARARGLPDAARLLQPAARDGVPARARQRRRATPDGRGLHVTTFHRLCETLGTASRRPGAKPDRTAAGVVGRDAAGGARRRDRRAARTSGSTRSSSTRARTSSRLARVARVPARGPRATTSCGSSTTPARRSSATTSSASSGLERLELFEDHRSPAPVAELAARFYHGPGEPVAARTGAVGAPRIIEAEPGDADRRGGPRELHRLTGRRGGPAVADRRAVGRVRAEQRGLAAARTFGNAGALERGDRRRRPIPRACRPRRSPTSPTTLVRSRPIRRFKGLERESSSCASCPRPASGSTSSSTSA